MDILIDGDAPDTISKITTTAFNAGNINLIKREYPGLRQESKAPT